MVPVKRAEAGRGGERDRGKDFAARLCCNSSSWEKSGSGANDLPRLAFRGELAAVTRTISLRAAQHASAMNPAPTVRRTEGHHGRARQSVRCCWGWNRYRLLASSASARTSGHRKLGLGARAPTACSVHGCSAERRRCKVKRQSNTTTAAEQTIGI